LCSQEEAQSRGGGGGADLRDADSEDLLADFGDSPVARRVSSNGASAPVRLDVGAAGAPADEDIMASLRRRMAQVAPVAPVEDADAAGLVSGRCDAAL
jgi:hypothetical protein